MPATPVYKIVLVLSEPELRALHSVLECPFVGDDDDLAGVIGSSHHNKLKTARRMYEKVLAAISTKTLANYL